MMSIFGHGSACCACYMQELYCLVFCIEMQNIWYFMCPKGPTCVRNPG